MTFGSLARHPETGTVVIYKIIYEHKEPLACGVNIA